MCFSDQCTISECPLWLQRSQSLCGRRWTYKWTRTMRWSSSAASRATPNPPSSGGKRRDRYPQEGKQHPYPIPNTPSSAASRATPTHHHLAQRGGTDTLRKVSNTPTPFLIPHPVPRPGRPQPTIIWRKEEGQIPSGR